MDKSIDQKKYVPIAILISFALSLIGQVLVFAFLPPDFSGDYPLYSTQCILSLQCLLAFSLIGLTLLGMKAEVENQILAAGGFTAQAISYGVAAAALFEISGVSSFESFEKFYNLNVASSFLYFPALLLISTYSHFSKFIRISTIIASIPQLIATILYLGGNRDFNTLENILNLGYTLIMFIQLGWGINLYLNYKKEIKIQQPN